ncbi:hypothetical protein PAXRUDRAFT_18157 [Paxillus rubicundulus Ve08.2h10]|uniref:DUF659 domain-containing protein n=1 Tax=Paxillus rubicundulus Ve08.2h10 TaxID=930991 RepID=A0A0D0BZN3_9AGAM|nr:hypothetical protein PAXRUDRAFT_18157 [Paxillus rubicundulus Ve08.2h10]
MNQKTHSSDNYSNTHNCGHALRIQKKDAVRARITEMGDMMLEDFKKYISVLEGWVSLSLDAWTSSNGYAFLAIVLHYVTNDWKLEEVLLEFQQ